MLFAGDISQKVNVIETGDRTCLLRCPSLARSRLRHRDSPRNKCEAKRNTERERGGCEILREGDSETKEDGNKKHRDTVKGSERQRENRKRNKRATYIRRRERERER